MDQQEGFESQFNTAVAQVMRLNELISRAHSAYLSGNLNDYRDVLNRIWMELKTYCKNGQNKRKR